MYSHGEYLQHSFLLPWMCFLNLVTELIQPVFIWFSLLQTGYYPEQTDVFVCSLVKIRKKVIDQ